jgi:hypothetical protein
MQRLFRTMTMGCVAILFLALAGCGNQYYDKMVGTWNSDQPGNPTFTLNKDGTGTMSALGITKNIKWRMNGSNWIVNLDGKDLGALIKSAEENKIHLHDPQGPPGSKDFYFTRVTKK